MKQEKLSFERDLWGQCNKLHDRLSKKKSYLTNLLKQLEPICDIFKDLQKKLESIKIIPDPTISKSLYPEPEENEDSKEPQLYGIPLTINKYISAFPFFVLIPLHIGSKVFCPPPTHFFLF